MVEWRFLWLFIAVVRAVFFFPFSNSQRTFYALNVYVAIWPITGLSDALGLVELTSS